ncbi:MAG: tetratricopeptide repeat protein [Pseudomonadales bacterium]|nr:tetratricopeptide repeat protein [Pseudomonadales bacterium]
MLTPLGDKHRLFPALIAVFLTACASAPEQPSGVPESMSSTSGLATNSTIDHSGAAGDPAAHSDTMHSSDVLPPISVVIVPEETKLQYLNAVKLLENGAIEQAKSELEALEELVPEAAGIYANLGAIAEQQTDLAEARDYYNKALSLNPAQPLAVNNLSNILRREGRFMEASQLLETGLKRYPRSPELHYSLGVLLDLYLHEPQKALRHYRQYQSFANPPDEQVEQWIVDLERRVE